MTVERVTTGGLTAAQLAALPAVIDVCTAAAVHHRVGRTAAYELIRTGRWPTPIVRVGHHIRIPTAPLLTLLGLSTGTPRSTTVPAAER